MQPSVRILPQMVRTHPRKKYICVHICAHRRKILSGVNEVLELWPTVSSGFCFIQRPQHIYIHTHTTSTRQFYMWAASFLLFPHTPLHFTWLLTRSSELNSSPRECTEAHKNGAGRDEVHLKHISACFIIAKQSTHAPCASLASVGVLIGSS